MKELREAAVEVARLSGAILKERYRGSGVAARSKSTLIDLVTDTDHAAEERILSFLSAHFPDHGVLAEESGGGGGAGDWRWVIDPLDGTVNFAHGQPHFSTLIAVQARDGDGFDTRIAVTLDPLRDELFVAVKGQGTTLNGESVRVSGVDRLIDATAVSGFQYNRLFREDDNHREFCRLNLLTQGVRRLGSAGLDLAYVAAGRIDFFWEYGLNPWDLAGGALLVAEAGGRVTAIDGGPLVIDNGEVLASNPPLHAPASAALVEARQLPLGSREGLAAHLPQELADEIWQPGS